jgi:general secretion pathway protein A
MTPFSISPLPSALYLTPSLRATLHKVNYVIENRQGLACIFGDVGVGKSSILRRLEGDLSAMPEVKLAFIPDPEISSTYAFVRGVCDYFEIPAKRSLDRQKEAFREYVFAQASEGNNVVLLLDEAQGLSNEMFEVIRSFLNYESNKAKLLQIVLAGQLELRARLKHNRPIRSRVIMYSLLDPLSLPEMKEMLLHRCELAGISLPFPDDGLAKIYEWSGGVPRDVLKVCANAYELSKLYEVSTVSLDLIEAAISQEERAMEEEHEEEEPDEQVSQAATA